MIVNGRKVGENNFSVFIERVNLIIASNQVRVVSCLFCLGSRRALASWVVVVTQPDGKRAADATFAAGEEDGR